MKSCHQVHLPATHKRLSNCQQHCNPITKFCLSEAFQLPTRLKSNNQVLLAGNLQEALQLPESGISANQVHLPLWKCQLPMQGNLCSSPFDTDSMTIGIDKWCSACILHCIEDFIDVLRPCHQTISSFSGSKVTNIQQGTILCQWKDDIGKVHEHTIPNSYYVPQGGLRLLSPQHSMQASSKFQGFCTTF